MITFLRDIRRVISGKNSRRDKYDLILDTADAEKGHYFKARSRFAQAVSALGIAYFEKGSLVDSPDQTHYHDRFAPSADQFRAMAMLAGFNAEIIARKKYKDEEGNTNNNLYWGLKVCDKPLNCEEFEWAISHSRTGSAPLYVTYI